VTPEEEARITGRDRGWKHASYVASYGPDTQELGDIITASRPGGYHAASVREEFAAGFREGMAEFAAEQELSDDEFLGDES
jgi:hypothetical protein